MTIRKLILPQDADLLGEMVLDSFQYPENPDWSVQEDEREGFVNTVKQIKRIWPLLNIAKKIFPSISDPLNGFIYEADGQPAGLVIASQRGKSASWWVGTVATNPQFRRRGIARKMVEHILAYFREQQGEMAYLDVIDGNLPAYTLYESLGFEQFSGQQEMHFTPTEIIPLPQIPAGYHIEKSSLFDWEGRFELHKRILPEKIRQYEPLDPRRFQQPNYMRVLLPILTAAQGIKEPFFIIRHQESGKLVGYGRYQLRRRAGGRQTSSLMLDPAHGHLAPALLDYCLYHQTSNSLTHVIEFSSATWQSALLEAARNRGFKDRVTYHRMGMKL